MKLKRFLLALTAVAMLAAFVASSASAADNGVTENGKEWYVNGTKLSGSTGVGCAAEGTMTLTGTVGSEEVVLDATEVLCEGATISNSEGMALDAGKLTFKGVKLTKPTGCEAPSTITTNALKSKINMGPGGVGVYDKFEPAAGEAGTFATVKLTGSCAAAGSRIVKGWVYGKSPNATGEEFEKQSLTFSPTVDSTIGTGLTLAGNPASISATVVNTLTGGGAFGVK